MEKKPKLSIVTTMPPIPGLGLPSIYSTIYLSKYFDVNVIAYKRFYPPFFTKKEKWLPENFNKIRKKVKYVIDLFNPKTWLISLKELNKDLFLFEWWNSAQLPFFLTLSKYLKSKNTKIFLELHNPRSHETYFPLEEKIFRKLLILSDHIIVHTNTMAEKIDKKIIPNKISVIPFGIYHSEKKIKLSKKEARRKLRMPEEKFILLFFGNIRPYKGLDILINSYEKLSTKHDELHLIIAGRPFFIENQLENKINQLVTRAKISYFPHFIKEEDVPLFFISSDLLVLPYKSFDSQSGVIMLSLNYEIPYIVSDVEGLKELALEKEGIFQNNEKALCDKIEEIIKSERIYKKLKESIKRKKKEFSWENYSKSIFELYSKHYSKY